MQLRFLSALTCCFLLTVLRPAAASTTCLGIKTGKLNAPSGTYTVITESGDWIRIYCEMGLNGGGYTFLDPMALTSLTEPELARMYTDDSAFLLRAQKKDGTQPYAVLAQLTPEFAGIPLKLGLSNHDGYYAPRNKQDGKLEPPFLYFGFIPIANASYKSVQGLMVNGHRDTFSNCDKIPNSQFTLYPNFKEAPPTNYTYPTTFCSQLFEHLLPNPSGRVIPPDYFYFGETTWGGCGCYKQTGQLDGVIGFTIGFR